MIFPPLCPEVYFIVSASRTNRKWHLMECSNCTELAKRSSRKLGLWYHLGQGRVSKKVCSQLNPGWLAEFAKGDGKKGDGKSWSRLICKSSITWIWTLDMFPIFVSPESLQMWLQSFANKHQGLSLRQTFCQISYFFLYWRIWFFWREVVNMEKIKHISSIYYNRG